MKSRDSLILGLVELSDALDLVKIVSSDRSDAVVEVAKVEVLVELHGKQVGIHLAGLLRLSLEKGLLKFLLDELVLLAAATMTITLVLASVAAEAMRLVSVLEEVTSLAFALVTDDFNLLLSLLLNNGLS